MEGFWVGVGSTATVVLAILGFNKWQASKIHLVGTIRRYPFAVPTQLSESLYEMHSVGYLLKEVSTKRDYPEDREQVSKAINKVIVELDRFKLRGLNFGTCSELELRNAGHEEAKNLEIRAEGAIVIEMERNGQWVELAPDQVPTYLRPGELRKYRIWQGIVARKIEVFQDRGRASIVEYLFSHPRFSIIPLLWKEVKALLMLAALLIAWIIFITYDSSENILEPVSTEMQSELPQ
ncbi:MAG: hypothetical protein Q7U10_02280 [Thermodesulfovibrionia bacterium]|nr:hypothetical protein [Thermodesulfovibrionia bacterium]